MSANHPNTRLPFAALTAAAVMLVAATGAQASEPPVKEILTSHFGREVNLTETNAHAGAVLEDVCTVESNDTCQPGKESSLAGGFASNGPHSVASSPNGNIYVLDDQNYRVQELTAMGEFVLMFGDDVNETTGGDVCTEEEVKTGVKCKAGTQGAGAGQFSEGPYSVAVDPTNGDVYVAELVDVYKDGKPNFGFRVQKFTGSGRFLLELGKEVNEKTKGNLCTEEEVEKSGAKCTAPALVNNESELTTEPGAFNLDSGHGNLLAVGDDGELYVGGQHRVQEFEAGGKYIGEISLTSISSEPESYITAIAVDKAGDVYLIYENTLSRAGDNIIREFNPSGEEIKEFPIVPREPHAEVSVYTIAVDPAGRLATAEGEYVLPGYRVGHEGGYRGSLYEVGATSLRPITEFGIAYSPDALAFGANDDLYASFERVLMGGQEVAGDEVDAYKPVLVGEVATGPAMCVAGVDRESDATLDCSLNGQVNPEGVAETEASFQYGATSGLGLETPGEKVPTGGALVGVTSAPIVGLRPNETLYYQLVGHDAVVKAPEQLTGEKLSFTTPSVQPRIVGAPTASFVGSSSAVLSGELNPENASTTYEFQYGACASLESCPGAAQTTAAVSSVYGEVATTLEATGLQPATTYHYRLFAVNTAGGALNETGGAVLPEGTFTTAPAPVPQAASGAASAVGATSATISGTVDPDGQPATYAFELGVYAGAATQYGIVLSGAAGAGTAPLAESLGLSGLQPGRTYAYRIRIASGYGTAYGEPMLFTTAGLPSVLTVAAPLAQLAIPAIAFPAEANATTTKPPSRKKTKAKRKRRRASKRRKKR
jgi:hypothetical protein